MKLLQQRCIYAARLCCPPVWHRTAPFHNIFCWGWCDQQCWLIIVSPLQAQTDIGHQELSKLMEQPRLGLKEVFEMVQAGKASRALHDVVIWTPSFAACIQIQLNGVLG